VSRRVASVEITDSGISTNDYDAGSPSVVSEMFGPFDLNIGEGCSVVAGVALLP
jgi:hypothetical protein